MGNFSNEKNYTIKNTGTDKLCMLMYLKMFVLRHFQAVVSDQKIYIQKIHIPSNTVQKSKYFSLQLIKIET